METRIAIAEDDPVARRQYSERFSFVPHIEIVAQAENGKALLETLERLPENLLPQVVLMDIEMPRLNGIETTLQLKQKYPGVEVMMLTVFYDDDKIFRSIQAGASGYLLKDCSIEELSEAVKELLDGGVPMSKSIARRILTYMQENDSEPLPVEQESALRPSSFQLTPREIEILEQIVHDETEYAIALNLGISQHTVRAHVKNIYQKLEVHSRGAVVKAAYEHNLLPRPGSQKP